MKKIRSVALVALTLHLQVMYAQPKPDAVINFKVSENTSLVDVLRQFSRQTGIKVFYSEDELGGIRVRESKCNNVSPEQCMRTITAGLPLIYKVEGKKISVQKNSQKENLKALLDDGNLNEIKQAETTSLGNSLLSNLNSAPSDTTKIKEGQIGEVIVTALGIKRQEKKLGYSVTQVKSEDVSTNKTINIQSALAGKVAGLDIGETATGIAGSKRTNIRGISTISPTGTNSPLWVIDGVPLNSTNFGRNNDAGGGIDYGDGLSMINPDDIETISVLKGNAAAALYGSRASNGVIIITTKSGKKSDKGYRVELSSAINFSMIKDFTDWQYVYGQGREGKRPASKQEALVTGYISWGDKMDGALYPQFDGQMRPYAPVKNNIRDFYSDAVLYANTLSISRASDTYNFRFSVGQTDSQDFIDNGLYKKRNASLNASTKFGIFELDLNSMYVNEPVKNRQNIGGNVRNAHYTITSIPTSVNVSDMKPGYNPDGTELIITESSITNPYFVINKLYEEDNKNRIVNALALRVKPAKGLFAQMKILQDYFTFRRMNYQPEGMNWQPFGGEYTERWTEFHELNYELTTGYEKDFGERFSTSFMLGANKRVTNSNAVNLYGTPFVVPNVHTYNNTIDKTTSTSLTQSQTNSLFGMAEFSFNKYLFLTLTGRNDWFSTLPVDNNNYFYPSASLSFVFSDALNLKGNFLNFGKLRGSFAQVSGGADPYSLDLSYGIDNVNYNGQVLQYISTTTIPNKKLKPLISSEYEVGGEFQFFKNFLHLDVAYFNKKIRNDIVAINVSNSSGYNKAVQNTGNIDNSGLEVMASLRPFQRDFKWNSTFTFSKNWNKVLDLGFGVNSLQIGSAKNDVVTVNVEKGLPYGVIKGAAYKRDDSGNIIFDKSGYPVIGDRAAVLGVAFHDKLFGWLNEFGYKNLTFRMLIDGKFGGKMYSQTNRWAYGNGKHKATLEGRENGIIGVGVKEDGTKNDVLVTPDRLPSYYSFMASIHENFIYDASFLKLRELSLGYTLPSSILSNTPIQKASISLTARNLFYFMNKLENVSPESSVTSSNAQGLENSGYPEFRSYGINFNLTF